jgi:nicotinic acid mononucleotide adenylyltransferase
MVTTVFIGTFDPLHGAHIGQLLRAYKFKPFSKVFILVNKYPSHKPNASTWQHRIEMAKLTLGSFELPFGYEVLVTESPLANDINTEINYKITGSDSLIENLNNPGRFIFAQRFPMIVLSVPGIDHSELLTKFNDLSDELRKSIKIEYVSETDVPMMNYDFENNKFISKRIHSTDLRSGNNTSLIPRAVQNYIKTNNLY